MMIHTHVSRSEFVRRALRHLFGSLLVVVALASAPAIADDAAVEDCGRVQMAARWQASPFYSAPRLSSPVQQFGFRAGDRIQGRSRTSMTVARMDGVTVEVECLCGPVSSEGCELVVQGHAAVCQNNGGCGQRCHMETTITPDETGYRPYLRQPSPPRVFWR